MKTQSSPDVTDGPETPKGGSLHPVVSRAPFKREAPEGKQDSIVAIKPCCNRVVFAAVNLPHVMDSAMRKEIGELVISGCKIEHWPVEAVRKADWGCKCESATNDPSSGAPANNPKP